MRSQICVLCIFNVLAVKGFEVLGINDGYRGLMEKIESVDTQQPRIELVEQWIEQKLDHFNVSDCRTWKMRYYEDSHFWKTNGPIYLFINGEASASPKFLTTGILYELAKETNGTMYVSEHRYYGKSQPINRTNFRVEDMKYLTIAQALADNEHLLRTIKNNTLYEKSKIVVVGGSYAGNLAAWMKVLYRNLVKVVISSSAPVEAKRDFYEYLEVVSNDYQKYGPSGCVENIKNIFQRYDTLCQTEEGIQELKKEENICNDTDMTKPENRQLFFLAKTSIFMRNAQYGTVEDIKDHCSTLMETQNVLIESDMKYYWDEELSCYDYDFDKMVQEYYDPKYNDNLCWTYQTCTEFGYFQSTTSDKQPFTKNIPVEWYDKFCMALFGVDFDKDRVNKGVNNTNEMYGGKDPIVYSVIFANGELDPWSALGIKKNMVLNFVIYIPKSSHCKDLFSNSDDDDAVLKLARAFIKHQAKEYLDTEDNVSPGP